MISPSDPVSVWVVELRANMLEGKELSKKYYEVIFLIRKTWVLKFRRPTECLAWELKNDPARALFHEGTDTQREWGGLKSWRAAVSLLSSAGLGSLAPNSLGQLLSDRKPVFTWSGLCWLPDAWDWKGTLSNLCSWTSNQASCFQFCFWNAPAIRGTWLL